MGPYSVRVILIEPEKAGNIGSIARSMKNFNVHDLWIVKSKVEINSNAKAYATHGIGILETASMVNSFQEATRDLQTVIGTSSVTSGSSTNIARAAISPRDLAAKLETCKGRVGIVFGRESSGLKRKEIEACDMMVRIPANPEYNVLNISVAASIIFYELFLASTTGSTEDYEGASRDAKERLERQFASSLERSKIQEHKRRLAIRAFQNVISRAFISRREASLLIGAFRKTAESAT